LKLVFSTVETQTTAQYLITLILRSKSKQVFAHDNVVVGIIITDLDPGALPNLSEVLSHSISVFHVLLFILLFLLSPVD